MPKTQQITIEVKEAWVSGTEILKVSDANTPTEGVNSITTDSVNQETGGTLYGRGVARCDDFFDSSAALSSVAEDSITVVFKYRGTEDIFTATTIQLAKANWNSSIWTLTSSTGAKMYLEPAVLEFNAYRKRADLSITTLIFVFMSVGIPIENGSMDRAITRSIGTFEFRKNI